MKIRIKKSTARKFQRAGRQAKKVLRSAARTAGRGAYYGVRSLSRSLMRLPVKTLWIGLGSLSTVLVLVIILALALPGRKPVVASAETASAEYPVAANVFEAPLDEPAANEAGVPPVSDGQQSAPVSSGGEEQPGGAEAENAAAPQDSPGNPGGAEDGTLALTGFTALSDGDENDYVPEIQARLMELGYMDSDEPTEHFGPLTESAIKSFQRHNGLTADGVIGPNTWYKLFN